MNKLKVGICGYGIVGKRRRVCVDRHPDLKMVGFCDKSFTDKKSTVDGLDAYKSYKDLLKIDLDILIVCMTNDIAPEVTIAGLKNGLHIFCEKPPGKDVLDIKKVIKVEKDCQNQKIVV